MSRTTSDHRAYVPGLGRGFLTPLYDVLHRFSGVEGLHGAMIDGADVRPGMRVLDVGCATGNLLLSLGRRQPGLELTGLDPDGRALARARRKSRRAGVAVDWREGFAQELPDADGSVDRVFSSLMLHHLEGPDQDLLLAEVRRVLRPDGRFVLADVDGHDAMRGHGFRHLLRHRFRRGSHASHGAPGSPGAPGAPGLHGSHDGPPADAAAGLSARVEDAGFAVESASVYPLPIAPVTIVVARR